MRQHTPDFVIIGAMKAGTTGLHQALGQHSQISMSSLKEPNYFCAPAWFSGTWERGPAWYEQLFEKDRELRGESSTAYTKLPADPGVAERMYLTNPAIKLIYLVRDPVNRAVSHYLHNYLNGTEKRPIHEALNGAKANGYIAATLYYKQAQRYVRRFGEEQVCILRAEDMWAAPDALLRTLANYLGLSADSFEGISIPRANEIGERAKRWLKRGDSERDDVSRKMAEYLRQHGNPGNVTSTELADVMNFSNSDRALLRARFATDQARLQPLIRGLAADPDQERQVGEDAVVAE